MKQVLILLLIISSQFAQGFKIAVGTSSMMHATQKEGGNNGSYGPSSPSYDLPSVKEFLKDAWGLQLGAEFQFKRSLADVAWAIGIDYESQTAATHDLPYPGSTISTTSITPKLTVRKYFSENTAFLGVIGVPNKSYMFKFPLANNLEVNDYLIATLGIRIGAGIEFEKLGKSQIFIGFSAFYDYGKSATNTNTTPQLWSKKIDVYDPGITIGIKLGMFFDSQVYEDEY